MIQLNSAQLSSAALQIFHSQTKPTWFKWDIWWTCKLLILSYTTLTDKQQRHKYQIWLSILVRNCKLHTHTHTHTHTPPLNLRQQLLTTYCNSVAVVTTMIIHARLLQLHSKTAMCMQVPCLWNGTRKLRSRLVKNKCDMSTRTLSRQWNKWF